MTEDSARQRSRKKSSFRDLVEGRHWTICMWRGIRDYLVVTEDVNEFQQEGRIQRALFLGQWNVRQGFLDEGTHAQVQRFRLCFSLARRSLWQNGVDRGNEFLHADEKLVVWSVLEPVEKLVVLDVRY